MTTRVLKPQDRARDRWVTIPGGPRIVPNAALGFHHRVLLTENAVVEPPINGTNGQRLLLRIEQPASGKTVTIHSAILSRGDVVIATTGGSVTILDFIYDHIALAWEVRGVPDLSSLYDDAGTAASAVSTHASTVKHPRLVGTATLSGGTITVADPDMTANSIILLTKQATGIIGHVYVSSRSVSTNFVITSSEGADDAVVGYAVWEP